jgi:hypothetical protein
MRRPAVGGAQAQPDKATQASELMEIKIKEAPVTLQQPGPDMLEQT